MPVGSTTVLCHMQSFVITACTNKPQTPPNSWPTTPGRAKDVEDYVPIGRQADEIGVDALGGAERSERPCCNNNNKEAPAHRSLLDLS